jgi:ketosteroid isomerase-like protein
MRFLLIIMSVLLITGTLCAAENRQDNENFKRIFSEWTNAFNRKDLIGSCELFSKDMIADYQNVPTKNYQTVCDGFKKIFKGKRDYKYQFKLHQVYQSDKLAAVRITWYLEIWEKDKLLSATQDEGLDIFKLEEQGTWRIVNYIGYPVHLPSQDQRYINSTIKR